MNAHVSPLAAYTVPSTGAVVAPAAAAAASWPAILCGAAAAAALSLILLALGSGLGFSAVSPWSHSGAPASAVGTAAVVWMIAMAALASGVGGYLAGRLRVRWADVPADETFFRDTAHGFLAWAIATLLTAALLGSAASGLVAGTADAGAQALGTEAGETPSPVNAGPDLGQVSDEYFVDLMFRSDRNGEESDDWSMRMEVGYIFAIALRKGGMSEPDRAYLSKLVMRQTGLGAAAAEQRVTQTFEQARAAAAELETTAREAADAARKLAAKLSLWIFVSLLVGAFCASYAATLGGRQRDQAPA